MGFPYIFPFYLQDTYQADIERIIINAQIYPADTSRLTRILIISKPFPYIVEVHDISGNLLAILENAYGLSYSRSLNQPSALDFKLPGDDLKRVNLIWPNEIWLRDYYTGELMHKFRFGMKKDIRR